MKRTAARVIAFSTPASGGDEKSGGGCRGIEDEGATAAPRTVLGIASGLQKALLTDDDGEDLPGGNGEEAFHPCAKPTASAETTAALGPTGVDLDPGNPGRNDEGLNVAGELEGDLVGMDVDCRNEERGSDRGEELRKLEVWCEAVHDEISGLCGLQRR